MTSTNSSLFLPGICFGRFHKFIPRIAMYVTAFTERQLEFLCFVWRTSTIANALRTYQLILNLEMDEEHIQLTLIVIPSYNIPIVPITRVVDNGEQK